MEKRIELYLSFTTFLGFTGFLAITKALGIIHSFGMKEILFAVVLIGGSRAWFHSALGVTPYSELSAVRKKSLFLVSSIAIPLLFIIVVIFFSTLHA